MVSHRKSHIPTHCPTEQSRLVQSSPRHRLLLNHARAKSSNVVTPRKMHIGFPLFFCKVLILGSYNTVNKPHSNHHEPSKLKVIRLTHTRDVPEVIVMEVRISLSNHPVIIIIINSSSTIISVITLISNTLLSSPSSSSLSATSRSPLSPPSP